MYLTDYLNNKNVDKSVPMLKTAGTTYAVFYKYWVNMLFQRTMRLFVWSNTDPVPPKEIESRLLMSGLVAITKLKTIQDTKSELTAMWCSLFGVTKYADEYKQANVRCPIYAGTRTIGTDCIIIDNNAIRNPLLPLVIHYAQLLAHNEVSIVNVLINARDAGGVPVAMTEKQKQSINDYYKRLYNGQFGIVTGLADMNVTFMGSDKRTQQDIKALFETRSAILKAFYGDVGIRTAFEKNNNSVTAEVVSDESMLIFNLAEMLDYRKRGAEKVNALYGTNWSVEISPDIDYAKQEEQEKLEQNQMERGVENAENND